MRLTINFGMWINKQENNLKFNEVYQPQQIELLNLQKV